MDILTALKRSTEYATLSNDYLMFQRFIVRVFFFFFTGISILIIVIVSCTVQCPHLEAFTCKDVSSGY